MRASFPSSVVVAVTMLVLFALAATVSPSALLAGDNPTELPLYPMKKGLKWQQRIKFNGPKRS